MATTLSVEQFGLTALGEEHLAEIEGGNLWGKVFDAVIGWVVGEALDYANKHVGTNSYANPAPRTYSTCDNV